MNTCKNCKYLINHYCNKNNFVLDEREVEVGICNYYKNNNILSSDDKKSRVGFRRADGRPFKK